MEVYKHKIFINNELLENFNFNNAVENIKPYVNRGDNIYIRNTFKQIIEGWYILWFCRDVDIIEEDDELVRIDSKNDQRQVLNKEDMEKLSERELKRVLNYFVIFDISSSLIYTTNSTTDSSSVNKGLIKKFLNCKEIKIDSVVDYEETLKQQKVNTITLKHSKEITVFDDEELNENLAKYPSEYFGADYIVSQKFHIDNEKFMKRKGAKNLEKLSNNKAITIYVEAEDEEGNEFAIHNNVVKKKTKLSDKKIKNGVEMYENLIEFIKL